LQGAKARRENMSVRVQNENVTAPLPAVEPVTASARADVAMQKRRRRAVTPDFDAVEHSADRRMSDSEDV